MKSLAIIGTGIAGMACGYGLHRQFDLTVYEKNDYPGGHTNTVEVEEEGKKLPVDTGFMVFNEVTYPNLIRLFKALEVPIKPTSMTFSVQCVTEGLEFSGSGWNGLFSQRKNLVRPRFWRLLTHINRFNQHAPTILDNPRYSAMTLGDYAREQGFSEDFLNCYLVPMSSAVWSTPPDGMLRFPAVTLVRFFKNHGFLGLNTQHPWLTVDGGSREYRDRIVRSFRDRIRLSAPAVKVSRQDGKVKVTDASGHSAIYDHAILACHADEALQVLDQPTSEERRLLSPFRYRKNRATLHTDDSVMPSTRRAWSSWNYRTETLSDGSSASSTIYWMNSLQGVSDRVNYFVSIDDPGRVQPSRILRRIDYTHPLFTLETAQAQPLLPRLNERGPIYFCGSYFRYGFHEDALVSAIPVVEKLGGRLP